MRSCQSLRALSRLTKIILGASFLFLTQLALAGPAEPPLELLLSADSRLVSATLIEINPTGRLVFKREEVFGKSNDVPELIDVSVTTQAMQIARIGERYIVGYARFHHDKRHPAGLTPSRKDAHVISSSGLDPAMFVDSPELRSILELGASEHGRESGKLRRLLLATFAQDQPALQRLAAGQFAHDREMSHTLSANEKNTLRKIAFNDQINPTTRSLLISAAADRPDDFGGWAGDVINKVLEITPVDGYPDGAADPTGLVLLSFDEASTRGIMVPFQSLSRWLHSTHQLYLERASTLLESLYPERRRSAFEAALGNTDSATPTYQFLKEKLREVDRQDVVTDAQKH